MAMTGNNHRTPTSPTLAEPDIEADTLFEVLASQRRRIVIAYLHEYPAPMALADLARELAAREHERPVTEISPEEIERIYVDLYHRHVPKMADAGIVGHTRDRTLVTLAESAEELPTRLELPSVRRS